MTKRNDVVKEAERRVRCKLNLEWPGIYREISNWWIPKNSVYLNCRVLWCNDQKRAKKNGWCCMMQWQKRCKGEGLVLYDVLITKKMQKKMPGVIWCNGIRERNYKLLSPIHLILMFLTQLFLFIYNFKIHHNINYILFKYIFILFYFNKFIYILW